MARICRGKGITGSSSGGMVRSLHSAWNLACPTDRSESNRSGWKRGERCKEIIFGWRHLWRTVLREVTSSSLQCKISPDAWYWWIILDDICIRTSDTSNRIDRWPMMVESLNTLGMLIERIYPRGGGRIPIGLTHKYRNSDERNWMTHTIARQSTVISVAYTPTRGTRK